MIKLLTDYFRFTERTLALTAYLVPPYPIMRYTWRDIQKMRPLAQSVLGLTTLVFLAAFLVSAYISVYVFVQDPTASFGYVGLGGLWPGLVSTYCSVRLLQALAYLGQIMKKYTGILRA